MGVGKASEGYKIYFMLRKLVVYGLLAILVYAVIGGFLGSLPYTGWEILLSFGVLCLTCVTTNLIFSLLLKIKTNIDSTLISALILTLVLSPIDFTVLVFAGLIAISSKYVFVIKKKHIFNPVAISLFILSVSGFGSVVWWVGSGLMLPVVMAVGILVLRKLRRFNLFLAFFMGAVTTVSVFGLIHKVDMLGLYSQILVSWPIFFFGTIMLTEPLTTPPRRSAQIIYGLLVGVLFGSSFQIGPLFSTPELALVAGNVYSGVVKYRQYCRPAPMAQPRHPEPRCHKRDKFRRGR